MSKKHFVPHGFSIPKWWEDNDNFILRMLTIHDVVKDYDAVMSSIHHLQETQPFGPDHKRPTVDFPLEQNLIDLARHHKEFQKKSSFAYTVMSPDESICLWCVYIYPATNESYEAEVIMRIRETHADKLDEQLYTTVKQRIEQVRPFKKVAYPWRIQSRETYNNW